MAWDPISRLATPMGSGRGGRRDAGSMRLSLELVPLGWTQDARYDVGANTVGGRTSTTSSNHARIRTAPVLQRGAAFIISPPPSPSSSLPLIAAAPSGREPRRRGGAFPCWQACTVHCSCCRLGTSCLGLPKPAPAWDGIPSHRSPVAQHSRGPGQVRPDHQPTNLPYR